MTDTADTYLWERRYQVLYRAQLSALYHRKHERFLAFWDRTVTAVAIVGGSAAFADLGGPMVIKSAAGLVALTSTVALVFGLAERARRHADLARQFLDLEAQIVRVGERNFTEAQVNDWDAQVRLLEATEPPTLGALVLACQNELAQARGAVDSVHPLSWWRRLTMHWSDARLPRPAG